MKLRWIIRDGKKVLQTYCKTEHYAAYEDVPVVQEKKERKFKVGQVWKTRDGKQVTIVDIDERLGYPIEGEYCGSSLTYSKTGKYLGDYKPHEHDLEELLSEEKPEKKEPIRVEGWVAVYKQKESGKIVLTGIKNNREEAGEIDALPFYERIAIIKVTGVESNEKAD